MNYFKILAIAIFSVLVTSTSFASTHKDLLKLNSELGYTLDKAYYDAGTKVDIVIFDLKELKRQDKKVDTAIMAAAVKAASTLRAQWLEFEHKRVALWKTYTRANPASAKSMGTELRKLQQKVDAFSKSSILLAQKIDNQTSKLRNGLVYKFPKEASGWWSKNFIRGLDLSYKVYGVNRLKHPGNYMNMEYAAKACYDLGLNLLSLEVRQQHQDKMLKIFNSYCGTPFLLWGSDDFFQDRDCVSFKYYGDRNALKEDVLKYIGKYKDYKFFAGIQLDEPVINDSSKRYGKLLEVKGIKEAYKQYIAQRKQYLENCGINVGDLPFTSKPKTPDQQALYIEWQMFKKQFMSDHYKWFFNMMLDQEKFASTVIMNRNTSSPQECSYVSMGKNLPYLGTDLYQNGTAVESFAMQLLKNSASKRAIFWPGAGYSCKTPAAFKRTLATGLTHADGIHMWTYTFCSKYRDANYFWRYGGSRPNFDDKKRVALQNWYPWAWDIMQNMYNLAGKADKYLRNRKSVAQTAILVSERTLMTKRLQRGGIRRYWENNLGIYCSIIDAGTPVDVCFIESLSPEKMKKYKVIIASDMRSITDKEMNILSLWVKNGGTLISSGGITLSDEWGRKKKNFKLNKVLGVDFKEWLPGAQKFTFSKINFEYPIFEKYASVSVHSKAQAVKWQIGNPAFVMNRYGHGLSYYFTAQNIGARIRTGYDHCGLRNQTYPGFAQLLRKIIKIKSTLPIKLQGAPKGVELQVQKSTPDCLIVNLVNWHDKREISGHCLQIKMPGKWRLIYPESEEHKIIDSSQKIRLKKFDIYQMLIIEKVK